MQDKIDLELKRLLTDSGATEDFWQQVEIWQREADETEDSATDGETDAELQRQIEIWQRDEAENEAARLEAAQVEARELDELLDRLLAESEPADSATDGEIEAEWLEKVKDWQRADEENEPARLEAEARELDELDALLDRLEAEPDL